MRSRPALFLCFLLFVAGCESGSAAGPIGRRATPHDLLDAARARTASAPTGQFTITVAAPGLERISRGAFDAPHRRYRFEADPETEIRLVEGRLYVRSADVAHRIGVDTTWMTGRVDDAAVAFGASDPLAFMDLLGGTTGPVVDAGDGRFMLTVTASTALAAATPQARDRLHAALAADISSPSLLDRPLAVTARVDTRGFIDQLVIDLGSGATLAVDFDHLGDPVGIDAPPPSQVTDVGAMLGR